MSLFDYILFVIDYALSLGKTILMVRYCDLYPNKIMPVECAFSDSLCRPCFHFVLLLSRVTAPPYAINIYLSVLDAFCYAMEVFSGSYPSQPGSVSFSFHMDGIKLERTSYISKKVSNCHNNHPVLS